MVKIYFFGTRSGTEPMEGMHHTSLGVEVGGAYYFVDAGENCTDSSFLMGVDPLKIKAIFITHSHIDHTAGLPGLIGNIRKMAILDDNSTIDRRVELLIPDMECWMGFYKALCRCDSKMFETFELNASPVYDGIIYDDEVVRVTAFHNHHMQQEKGDGWMSYSYLFEVEKKKIVFSGDVRDMYDLDQVIGDGCDIAIIETGHHKVQTVGEYVATKNIGKVILTHHGREIINGRQEAQKKVEQFKCKGIIAYDGMTEEII